MQICVVMLISFGELYGLLVPEGAAQVELEKN